jgi:hypothetical protein
VLWGVPWRSPLGPPAGGHTQQGVATNQCDVRVREQSAPKAGSARALLQEQPPGQKKKRGAAGAFFGARHLQPQP